MSLILLKNKLNDLFRSSHTLFRYQLYVLLLFHFHNISIYSFLSYWQNNVFTSHSASPLQFRRGRTVNDRVAWAFVHELVNMIDDREYLSPLQATIEHCSPPIRIVTHRLSYSNQVDVQSLTTALCRAHRRSPCGSMVNGCGVMSSRTLDKHFRDEDSTPRTMMAFVRLALLTRDSRVREAVEVIDQPVRVKNEERKDAIHAHELV